MRRRFGLLALVVGALAVITAWWFARRREAGDAIRESYEVARERFEAALERIEAARERFEEARERQLSEWVRERRQETDEEPARGTGESGSSPREEIRSTIRESVRRSRGEA